MCYLLRTSFLPSVCLIYHFPCKFHSFLAFMLFISYVYFAFLYHFASFYCSMCNLLIVLFIIFHIIPLRCSRCHDFISVLSGQYSISHLLEHLFFSRLPFRLSPLLPFLYILYSSLFVRILFILSFILFMHRLVHVYLFPL
jgi:hypothetical protein